MGNKLLDSIGEKATEWLNNLTAKEFKKAKEVADLNSERLKQIVGDL